MRATQVQEAPQNRGAVVRQGYNRGSVGDVRCGALETTPLLSALPFEPAMFVQFDRDEPHNLRDPDSPHVVAKAIGLVSGFAQQVENELKVRREP